MSDREDLPIDDNLAVQPTNNDAVEETPKPIPKRGRGRPRKDGTTPAVKRTVVKKTHRRPDDEFETTTYYKRKEEVEASGERRTSKRPRKCRRKTLNEKEMCDKGMFCSFSFFYCNCPFPTSCNLLLLDCHRVHSTPFGHGTSSSYRSSGHPSPIIIIFHHRLRPSFPSISTIIVNHSCPLLSSHQELSSSSSPVPSSPLSPSSSPKLANPLQSSHTSRNLSTPPSPKSRLLLLRSLRPMSPSSSGVVRLPPEPIPRPPTTNRSTATTTRT